MAVQLVVIPTERDDLEDGTIHEKDGVSSPERIAAMDVSFPGARQRASTFDSFHSLQSMNSQQHGALFRRVVGSNTAPPPIPAPSRIVGSGAFASTHRSVSGSSNVSFQNPPVDNNNMTGRIGQDTREEKSV
jgi:hypothetical protein